MLDIAEDIRSLSDFKRNTPQHLQRLKNTGRPEVLTINGKAQVVVQDAQAYQKLLDELDGLDAIKHIREALTRLRRGDKAVPARQALREIAAKVGVKLEP